jgi:glycerol-3-phosphate cytidylyltransferase|tara:strand:+ start:4906 stop:5634 length:729 start_codon:yes stop_codon:yes gene_type:complete
MVYCFDLDNTLCATPSSKKYHEAVPYHSVIHHVNSLYKQGHIIKIFTARGAGSGKNWHALTLQQLDQWGVRYNELIDKGKPSYDLLVDDKAANTYQWRKEQKLTITGIVAGAFDLLHAGHCLYIKEAKSVCDYLYVALQRDPTLDNPEDRALKRTKNKPIQSLNERRIQLEALSAVDEIIEYDTEKDLHILLKSLKPNIRILGSDYQGKRATGQEFSDGVIYHARDHDWSSSSLRQRIYGNQ